MLLLGVIVMLSVTCHLVKGESKLSRTVNVSPGSPGLIAYGRLINNLDLVVTSEDPQCMIVSLQDYGGSSYLDSESNVKHAGYWHTMISKGGMTIHKDRFPKRVAIILVVLSDDSDCISGDRHEQVSHSTNREKTVKVTLKDSISSENFWLSFSLPIVFTIVVILAVLSHYIFNRVKHVRTIVDPDPEGVLQRLAESQDINIPFRDDYEVKKKSYLFLYTTFIVAMVYSVAASQLVLKQLKSLHNTGSLDVCYYNNYCAVPWEVKWLGVILLDSNHFYSNIGYVVLGALGWYIVHWKEQNELIEGGKKVIITEDNSEILIGLERLAKQADMEPLGRQPSETREDEEKMVITEETLEASQERSESQMDGEKIITTDKNKGERDRDKFEGQMERAEEGQTAETKVDTLEFGIPPHFGLYKAQCLAIIVEGVLSGFYHVCPNRSNFHHDVCFMYVMVMLIGLKLYHGRHPKSSSGGIRAFSCIACVLLLSVLGEGFESYWFWAILFVFVVISTVLLSVQVFYSGEFRILEISGIGELLRMVMRTYSNDNESDPNKIKTDKWLYGLILVGNLYSIVWGIVGICYRPHDFDTHLLALLGGNVAIYLGYYIFMKMWVNKEKSCCKFKVLFVLAFVFWGGGIFCFSQNKTSWELTPAKSRELNGDCLLFDFYDFHDLWHFLSAAALFLTLMALLFIDEDLKTVERTEYKKF